MDSARRQLPHFTVTALDGQRVAYADIWQRRNLLLVCLAGRPRAEAERQAAQIHARAEDLQALETTAVVTTERLAGLPCPGVTVADRWGEVVHAAPYDPAEAPAPLDELFEWLQYVQHTCPECEGETR